jgi:hypothetical protein
VLNLWACQQPSTHAAPCVIRHVPPTSAIFQRIDICGQLQAALRRMKADGHTGKDIAKYLGVSRATVYRYFAEKTA